MALGLFFRYLINEVENVLFTRAGLGRYLFKAICTKTWAPSTWRFYLI